MPLDLISEERDYDKEKYREMLLEVCRINSGIFGFDRTYRPRTGRKIGSGGMSLGRNVEKT